MLASTKHKASSMSPSEAQLALPIYASREAVLKAVKENQIVVVEAPTGSGKTTQLPQASWTVQPGLPSATGFKTGRVEY